MKPSPPSLPHLHWGANAADQPIGLIAGKGELAWLAFDLRLNRLVEFHWLNGGHPMEASERAFALERARAAATLQSGAFPRVLDLGEWDGAVYYLSAANDGELVGEFVARTGPVHPLPALAMVHQWIEALIRRRLDPGLMTGMRLDSMMVRVQEGAFLQLRLIDYGFNRSGLISAQGVVPSLLLQLSQLLFLLLSGDAWKGQDPDSISAITKLPTRLRSTLRRSLRDGDPGLKDLESLQDQIRETLSTQGRRLTGAELRKHLQLNRAFHPQSRLREILLEGMSFDELFRDRYRIRTERPADASAFAIPARDAESDRAVTIHMLPPDRLVPHDRYEAFPQQSWHVDPGAHPNLLRCLSLWEGEGWRFSTEERPSGVELGRLLVERGGFNPAEVLVLLRQVRDGLRQMGASGGGTLELHPFNLFLALEHRAGSAERETERLMGRRLDAWPPFVVKLRPHMTLRGLLEPPLLPLSFLQEEPVASVVNARSFVALAIHLLSAARGIDELPSSIPTALRTYLREKATAEEEGPDLETFLSEFDACLGSEEEPGLNPPPPEPGRKETSAVKTAESSDSPPGRRSVWRGLLSLLLLLLVSSGLGYLLHRNRPAPAPTESAVSSPVPPPPLAGPPPESLPPPQPASGEKVESKDPEAGSATLAGENPEKRPVSGEKTSSETPPTPEVRRAVPASAEEVRAAREAQREREEEAPGPAREDPEASGEAAGNP